MVMGTEDWTSDEQWAALTGATTTGNPNGQNPPIPDGDPLAWAHIINWDDAFTSKPDTTDWLIEPLLERGTLNAWFGKPGAGKSLLALEAAAGLASGSGVLGQTASEPVTVVYVDVENSANDVVERLTAFGYAPDELSNLIYSLFPDLPALDTPDGGRRLLELADAHQPALMIIDTTARVIQGKENDADTFLQLYRNALIPLKQRGITVLRLDHPGKDTDRGQRGSSAKDGDVDTVWHVAEESGMCVNFDRRKSRSGHGTGALYLRRRFNPLRHEPGGSGIAPKVARIIDLLCKLGAPGDFDDRVHKFSNAQARTMIRNVPERCGNDDLAEALRLWEEHSRNTPGSVPGHTCETAGQKQ
jgi:AAA domain